MDSSDLKGILTIFKQKCEESHFWSILRKAARCVCACLKMKNFIVVIYYQSYIHRINRLFHLSHQKFIVYTYIGLENDKSDQNRDLSYLQRGVLRAYFSIAFQPTRQNALLSV